MPTATKKDWIQEITGLKHTLSKLRMQPFQWPAGLDSKNVHIFTLHHQYVFTWLSNWVDSVLQLEEQSVFARETVLREAFIERKIAELKDFLTRRDPSIATLSVDYVSRLPLFANQACLVAAEMIGTEAESVCQLVKPSVTRVVGSATPEDIKGSTEDADGKFRPWRFVMRSDGATLIAIKDYLDYVRVHEQTADQFFASDSEDVRLICQASGPVGLDYVDALHRLYNSKTANNDERSVSYLGVALERLEKALEMSSVGKHGSEGQANMADCERPILEVYRIWNSLRIWDYYRIRSYRGEWGAYSLEDNLLSCFPTVLGTILTKEEQTRMLKNKILNCAACRHGNLKVILDAHPDLYDISVGEGKRHEKAPTAEELDTLSEKLTSELDTQAPILGADNAEALARCAFFTLSAYFDSANLDLFFSDRDRFIREKIVDIDRLLDLMESLKSEQQRFALLLALDGAWQLMMTGISHLTRLFDWFSEEACIVLAQYLGAQLFSIFLNNRSSLFVQLPSLRSFQEKLLICAPDVISTSSQMIQMMFALSPEQYPRLMQRLSRQLQRFFVGYVGGKRWGEVLLDVLAIITAPDSVFSINNNQQVAAWSLLHAALPIVAPQYLFEQCWHASVSCFDMVCCFSVFSNKKLDFQLYQQLNNLELCDTQREDLAYKASVQRVECLHRFIQQRIRGILLCKIEAQFCDRFFERVTWYINQSSPLPTLHLSAD